MIITSYTCPNCKFTIYERYSGDRHTCYCGTVDCCGRLADQTKIAFFDLITIQQLEVKATPDQLRLDFLYNLGQFGTIKPVKVLK
jgi:hypothetical protein